MNKTNYILRFYLFFREIYVKKPQRGKSRCGKGFLWEK